MNHPNLRKDDSLFLIHYKNADELKYKVGNKKDHKGTTFFFCDCTIFCNKLKWHTHHPDKCLLYNKWLKKTVDNKSIATSSTTDATTNLSKENIAYDAT